MDYIINFWCSVGVRLYEKDAKTRIKLASHLVEELIEVGSLNE
jgi:hypothetical protein